MEGRGKGKPSYAIECGLWTVFGAGYSQEGHDEGRRARGEE